MKTTPENMNAESELAFIREIIARSRTTAAEDGLPYIAWGVLVAVGMIVSYCQAIFGQDLKSGYVWIALIVTGWISSFWYSRKARNDKRTKSFTDKLQGAIWFACGSTLGLVIVVITIGANWAGHDGIPPLFACAIAAFILGIAYYLSGYTLEIAWLRNIGFAWWAGGILMYFLANIHVVLIYAVMLLLFQVVPGFVLNRKYRETLLLNVAAE